MNGGNTKPGTFGLMRKLAVFLIVFTTLEFSCSVADGARCILSSGQSGECRPLKECRTAIASLRRNVEPEYCSFEQESVCCVASGRGFRTQYENERYESVNSDRTPIQPINPHRNLYITESGDYDHGFTSERRRPSTAERTTRSDIVRRNNQDSGNYHFYVNTPNNVNHDRDQPDVSDDLTNRRYFYEGGYFVPPGLVKKKPWGGEKSTENYYEYVTKKPNRGQGPKGPNKHHNSGHNPPEHNQPPPPRTTKRPEGMSYPSEWTSRPGQYSNNNIQNQWTTTRRNKWTQETTTIRNQQYTNGPSNPKVRPHHTSTPSVHDHSSQSTPRPHGNGPNNRPGPQRKMRTSEQKCQEYSKEVTENITGLPLTTDPNPVIIPVRKCVQAQQLIVGGENTTIGEFPHMAAVGFRNRNNQGISWNCGGTLISELFVLTAAHCTSTSLGRPVKVRLGEYNLMKNDDGAYPVDYGIAEIINHPDYKPPSKYHDIALLKLTRKVKFFKHIRPACLYLDDTLTTTKAIATGWGRMFYDGNVSEVLQKVVLNIVDKNTCNRLYKVNVKTEVLSRGIVDSQLCAGELSGGKDTCQGDSGGPLSITNTKCIHHIIGITSFGKSCALPNSTGVYTKVSTYVPWIESIVWPQGYNFESYK